MSVRFKIIVPMCNVADAISKNIEMLRAQSFRDFHCVLLDDLSLDNTVAAAREAIGRDERFTLKINPEKKYALRNAVDTIRSSCDDDDDVIVPVDGDDQLAHDGVLSRLADAYGGGDCWLTYGSYVNEYGMRGKECSAYPRSVVDRGAFRGHRWHATHLKSFRFGLWRHVSPEAFRATAAELKRARIRAVLSGELRAWYHWRGIRLPDLHEPSGQCFRRCYDKAIMFPMLELAGAHSVYLSDVLYRYRSCSKPTPGTVRSSVAKWQTRCIQHILQLKPSFSPLLRQG